jgi:hypothetical protein
MKQKIKASKRDYSSFLTVDERKELASELQNTPQLANAKEAEKRLIKSRFEQKIAKAERIDTAKSMFGETIGSKFGKTPRDFKARQLPRTIAVGENLTREQRFLGELFGGNGTLGRGNNLPEINGVLRSGHGLINNNDFGDTGSMFGMFRRRII